MISKSKIYRKYHFYIVINVLENYISRLLNSNKLN